MDASRVVQLVSMLEANGVGVWLIGGWAIDALVDRQRRPHDDLDVLIADADVTAPRVSCQATVTKAHSPRWEQPTSWMRPVIRSTCM